MGKRADGLAHFMPPPVNDAFASDVEIAERCVSYTILFLQIPIWRLWKSFPNYVTCQAHASFNDNGRNVNNQKSYKYQLHAQNSMERKARKVNL